MYQRQLQREQHTQRFLIIPTNGDGWEVHRVEAARLWFATEVDQLRAAGWTEVAS